MICTRPNARGLAFVWIVLVAFLGGSAAAKPDKPDEKRPDRLVVANVMVTSRNPQVQALKASVEVRQSTDLALIATAGCVFGQQCAVEVSSSSSVLIVSADASGFWPEQQVLTVPENGHVNVALRLSRTGVVRGQLKVPRGQKTPAILVLKFAQVREGVNQNEPLSGELSIAVEDGKFEVEIPEGRQDLKLRAKGFVSRFFWNTEVTADKTLSLNTLALQPGSSIVGRIERFDQIVYFNDVKIELEPVTDPLRADRTHQSTFATTEVLAESRGVFAFDGVRPGTYRIGAPDSTGATASFSPVVVYGGSESEIVQPLILPTAGIRGSVGEPGDQRRRSSLDN